jgi:subtilisin family serine protease
MKLVTLIVSALLVTVSAQAKDRYIVQFKSSQGYQAMKSYFATTEALSPNLQHNLDNVNAMVFKTKNLALLNSLKNHPEVLSVEAERFFPAPKPVNGFKLSIAKVSYVESLKKKKPAMPTADSDMVYSSGTPWGIKAVHAGEAWGQSSGQNARVLVLDTGVDAEHPAIAPNFEKGKNFTENSSGQVVAGDYNDEEGHGTHTSGTVAGAYNAATGFSGVAPKAHLLMGKVCGTDGCSSVAIVEGINWGIQEKVDVISMSLGGPIGSTPEKTAVQNAEKAGVMVVAASGNGADDPNYSPNKNDPKCGNSFFGNSCGVSFPAAFPTVMAVGAINEQLAKTSFSQWGPELDIAAPGAAVTSSVPRGSGRESKVQVIVNGTATDVKSSAFSGTELIPNAVVNSLVSVPGVGKPEDFSQVDVKGKFALVKRGEIKFAEKVQNAINAGATGVMIYNHSPGLISGSLSEDGTVIPYPVVMVEQTTGEMLASELTRGSTVSASVTLAPTDYASFDGTSMATPHVAGVAALVRSVNKKLTPAQVRALLASTAMPLSPNDTNQFGAGMVQADAAVRKAAGQ